MIAKLPIPPATLLSTYSYLSPQALSVTEYTFQVPLDYANPDAGTITIFARSATKSERPLVPSDSPAPPRPYMVYLQGGPGFGCENPSEAPPTHEVLKRGYQIIYIDHRGTGMSTPVTAETLDKIASDVDGKVKYLKLLRQDNTVRDCEAIRKYLNKDLEGDKAQWSLLGQSYGGFIGLSYLSMHPEGLRECYFTGGMAPIGKTAEELYTVTFGHVEKRTDEYYAKFPQDIDSVKQIAAYIESQGGSIALPNGGKMTVPRFMTFGIIFGKHGGFDMLHEVVLRLKNSLDQFGFFVRPALKAFSDFSEFDECIIYAILHEAIYCDGPIATNWSAQRVGEKLDKYSWLKPGAVTANTEGPLYFSGEMIFPSHFDNFSGLQPLKEVAQKLAESTEWDYLYDQEQLKKNEVPVYAASYVSDMFVDFGFATNTANMTKNTKVFATNILYHNAIRPKTADVLVQLFKLRDDVMD